MSLNADAAQNACDELVKNQQSLLLASRRSNGDADISYAPYLLIDNVFYIFVSTLASHTDNLLNYPKASLLFIEAESSAANPFARRRLTLDSSVARIPADDPAYPRILDALAQQFGETVSVLRGLTDFQLLALTPLGGRFVAGFGKAYPVDERWRIQHPSTA